MATSIEWDGGELTNGAPAPGDRFRGWIPISIPIGPLHHALGTGIPYKWTHRDDYGAKFSLPYIPNSEQDTCAQLIRHLLKGGLITVNTGDDDNNTYDCYLWPGSTPELSPPDPKDLKRVLTISVLNGVQEDMICAYR